MSENGTIKRKELFKDMGISEETIHIFDNVYDGIIIFYEDSTVIYVNQDYERIMGISPGQLMGKKLSLIEPNAKALFVLEDGKPIIDKHT